MVKNLSSKPPIVASIQFDLENKGLTNDPTRPFFRIYFSKGPVHIAVGEFPWATLKISNYEVIAVNVENSQSLVTIGTR